MASQDDVRRIALSLPDTVQDPDYFAFSVQHGKKTKGFVWIWRERVDAKKPKVPNPEVIAVRVANEAEKQMLLSSDATKFFTEPHYNGYPAVLVRLAAIETEELTELITDAWRCQAPSALVKEYEQHR